MPNVLSRNSTTVASRPLKSPDNPEKRTSATTIRMHPGGSNANSSVHCTVDGGSTAVLVGSTNTATSFNEDFNIAGSRHTGDNSRDGKDIAPYSSLAVSDMGSQRGKFSCELCPYVTKYKSHLERHVRVHTGEKPFKCDICSRAFSQLSTLKEHKHSHMGEKVTCEVCSLELSSNRSLKRHMRRHTGERPFKWNHCPTSFPYKKALTARSHSYWTETILVQAVLGLFWYQGGASGTHGGLYGGGVIEWEFLLTHVCLCMCSPEPSVEAPQN